MKYNTINIYYRLEDSKENYYTITDKKKYLLSEWVDQCWKFRNGFGIVRKDRKENYVKPDGTYLFSKWVDECYYFQDGFGVVKIDGKYNYVKPDGSLLLSEWYENCSAFSRGYGRVRFNDIWHRVDKYGNIE